MLTNLTKLNKQLDFFNANYLYLNKIFTFTIFKRFKHYFKIL